MTREADRVAHVPQRFLSGRSKAVGTGSQAVAQDRLGGVLAHDPVDRSVERNETNEHGDHGEEVPLPVVD